MDLFIGFSAFLMSFIGFSIFTRGKRNSKIYGLCMMIASFSIAGLILSIKQLTIHNYNDEMPLLIGASLFSYIMMFIIYLIFKKSPAIFFLFTFPISILFPSYFAAKYTNTNWILTNTKERN